MVARLAVPSALVAVAVVSATWLPLPRNLVPPDVRAFGAAARCKTVIKKVHGHRKKVRVCKRATPTSTPVPERLPGPSDLVVDSHGNLLVAVQGNDSIVTLSPDGSLFSSWTRAGTNPATFEQLRGIAIDPMGSVYVTDALGRVIDKLDSTGRPIAQWSSDLAEPNSFPTLLALAHNGDLYVSDHTAHAVLHLSPDGHLLGVVGKGDLGDPYGVTVGSNGNLYVADFGSSRVRQYTPSGSSVAVWGGGEEGSVKLESPEAIALDPTGNIYVTEQAGQIVKFDQTGHVLARWGLIGSLSLQDPSGIALDSAGNIFVAEYEGNRVDKLSPAGQLLASWH